MEESFSIKNLGDYSDSKITAIGLFENYIIIGDDKGNIQTLIFGSNKKVSMETSQSVANGKKIEKIVISAPLSIAYVLFNGEVHLYRLPKLENLDEIKHKESIMGIAINAAEKIEGSRLLTISKKKKLRIYQFDKIDNKIKEIKRDKDITVEELPEMYEWYENYLCYKHKNKVHWIQMVNGNHYPMDMEAAKGIKYVHESLVVTTGELGLFLDVGSVKPMTPVTFAPKFVDVAEFKTFLISLHEDQICAFIRSEQKYDQIQSKEFSNETGRFLLESKKRILYVTSDAKGKYQFYHLEETPYDKIIKKLLESGSYEEALNKLNDNVSPLDEEKPKKIEQFFLDCCWKCLESKQFSKAYEYGHITNFNPFEFIYLFFSLLGIKIIHTDFEKKIKDSLSRNQIKGIIGEEEGKLKEAYSFLQKMLLDKRNFIISKYEFPRDNNEELKFDSSEYSLINLSSSETKVKLIELVNVINLTLVKVMIKSKQQPKDIVSIIDNNCFVCTGICDFPKDPFFEENNTDECQLALAYFYEKKGEYEKALAIWKKFGTEDNKGGKRNPLFSSEAKERTKRIFYKFKSDSLHKDQNLKLFQEYIQWLLLKYPEDSFEVTISTQFVPIDLFLSNIIAKVEQLNKDSNLSERFLTFHNERCPNEKYQTKLIEGYIDKLLKMKSPDTNLGDIPFEGELKTYYDLLMTNLKKKDSCYLKNFILGKVKGTWLIDAEIFLYSELKLHNNALDKLLDCVENDKKHDFSKVEQYCEENFANKSDIFADFFLKLIERKKKVFPDNNNSKEDRYETEMLNVLKKYGEVSKLDPIFALENIPSHLNVCDGILYDYITKVIKEYTSLTNKYKVARNISDMALIYKEKEVLDAKDKCVIIENDTTCELCRKKIGNTIFVVYPNMKIYHSKCAVNMSICPTTGVDFTKKKIV